MFNFVFVLTYYILFWFCSFFRLGVPNGPAAAEPPSPIGGYQQVVASGQAGGSVTLASSSGGGQGGGGGEPLNRILNALSNRGLLSQQNGKFYYVGGEKGGGASSNNAVSSAAATVTTGLTSWKFKGGFLFLSTVLYSRLLHLPAPHIPPVSEDTGIKPRAVATTALAVRRSNHSAKSHLHLTKSH